MLKEKEDMSGDKTLHSISSEPKFKNKSGGILRRFNERTFQR